MEIQKDLAFPKAEYLERLAAVRSRMDEAGLDALLVTNPENICYLSGYQTSGYYYPQTLVVTHGQDPHIVVRKFEGKNVDAYAWIDASNRHTFEDNEDPMTLVAQTLAELGVADKVMGFDLGSWFYTVNSHQRLTSLIPHARVVDASGLVEAERAVKSPREISYVRDACRVSSSAIGVAVERLSSGPCTENDLAAEIHRSLVGNGGEYPGLPLFLGSGHRSLIPHVNWTAKPVEKGENVLVELTAVVRRYAGPLFRTLYLGTPSDTFRDRAKIVRDMLEAVIEAVRPGVTSNSVNEAAVRAARALGAGVTKRAGYSVGLNFPPDWGEGAFLDLKAGDETVLRPGMSFHVPQSLRLEGELPVAISETLVVTDDGCEVLTDFPRDLIVVD